LEDLSEERILDMYVGLNIATQDGTTYDLASCSNDYCGDCNRAGEGSEGCTAIVMMCVILTLMTCVLRLYTDLTIIRQVSSAIAALACIMSLAAVCVFGDCKESVSKISPDIVVEYGPGYACMVVVFIVMLPVLGSHVLIQVDDRKIHLVMTADDEDEEDGPVMQYDPENDEIPASWVAGSGSRGGDRESDAVVAFPVPSNLPVAEAVAL
jgi:hypothetical protein